MSIKQYFKKHEYEIWSGDFERSELFKKSHFDRENYFMNLFLSYFLVFMATIFCVEIILTIVKGAYILSVELFICGVICSIGTRIKMVQKAKDLHCRLKKVPKQIKENSKMLYGVDWRDSAVECYESHVGGDCPLCGAE